MKGQAQLAPMRVCIFGTEKEARESLILNTAETGYAIAGEFSEARKLLEFVSASAVSHIVVIDVSGEWQEALRLIKELCAKQPLPIVVTTNEADERLVSDAVDAGAQCLLVKPFQVKDICAAFLMAVCQCSKQSRIEHQSEQLRTRLEERKIIERAKGIIMDSARMTEAEAFRLIQKQSQDKRCPMIEIARSIISTTTLMEEAVRSKGS